VSEIPAKISEKKEFEVQLAEKKAFLSKQLIYSAKF
jgi:hypothetical protein